MSEFTHRITVVPLEARFEVGEHTSLLLAAEQAGIELPSSCRNGTCRTCLCRLAEGTVVHTIAWPGLSLEEKRDGFILPCVARATSDVVLAVPAARWRRSP